MLQGLGAGRGRIHVVLAHPEVDPERTEDLGLVVDDEDSGHEVPPGGDDPPRPLRVPSARAGAPAVAAGTASPKEPSAMPSARAGKPAVAAGTGAAGSERAMVSP